MANEELSDTDLFNEAMNDEETQQEQQQTEQTEQHQEEQRQEVQTEQTQERQQVDDNAALVPSWRVREINEEKRTLADKVAALEAERANWQRQQPQVTQQPPKAVEKPATPDPLLDPEGYRQHMENSFNERLLGERREMSLRLAKRTYKEEFDEAYKAAQKQVDPVLRARMQASDDPGETLIEWHRENKQRAEIGNDLTAYKQRLREEALKDPEFRKLAMEAWRSDAQQPQQQNGRPRVELPPSLSGASRASAASRQQETEDVSDRELFQQVAG